jgi:hypothetical protein
LIAAGCDIHLKTRYGTTAISLAISGGHLDIAKILVDRGSQNDELDDPILDKRSTQQLIKKFIEQRNGLRFSIIMVIAFQKHGVRCFGPNNRDVSTLIMKHLWLMRFGLSGA